MKKFIFLFSIAVLLGFSATTYAAEFVTGNKDTGGQVSVPASASHKNLYIAGSQVSVNGATTGDLTAAGGSVVLNGPVSGGLLAAGGSVFSNASVTGNARVAGGNITINAPVGGDLVAAGGTVTDTESGPVAGDLVAAGGSLAVNAPVAGNAYLAGGSVYINSKIGGFVKVTASKSLSFGPRAEISGDIFFQGSKPATLDPLAKVKTVNFTQIKVTGPMGQFGRLAGLGILIQLLAYIIVGFVVMRFGKKFVVDSVSQAKTSPWASLGIGLAGLIVIPVAVILLFITIIGYYAALMVLFSYIILLMVTIILGTLFLGEYLLRLFNKSAVGFPDWQIIVLGVAAWEILKLIPVVGWVALAVIYLMALGASLTILKRTHQRPA